MEFLKISLLGERLQVNGNGSGSRREPPNIDDLISNLQRTINKFLPGGKSGGSKPIILGLIILVVIWVLWTL